MFDSSSHAESAPPARLTQFNMLRFELEGLQRSIYEQEAMMNQLIDEAARKYTEGLKRRAGDSSSSVTSGESGRHGGTQHNFSVDTGDSTWCGCTEHNFSVTSFDFSPHGGDQYDYTGIGKPSDLYRVKETEKRKAKRNMNGRRKRAKKAPKSD